MSPANAEEAIGRVRTVYYEAARGVLVDAKMTRRASVIRWVDVEVNGRMVLVQMPASLNAAVGDVVAVRLAEPKSNQLAQILPQVAVSRVLEVNPPQFAGRQEPNASTGR
jgi:phosphoribosylformylglycinamidine (FGAM) synthase-like enzyme